MLYLLQCLRGGSDFVSAVPPHRLQMELAAAVRERILPWLWSISLHTCLLFVLALIFLPALKTNKIEILSGFGKVPVKEELPFSAPLGIKNAPDEATAVITPQDVPPVENPLAVPAKAETDDVANAPVLDASAPPGLSLVGRDIGSRSNMLGRGGGSSKTDEAVVAGLTWLVRVQEPDGSWHLAGRFAQHSTKDRDNPQAATAMALLAFQGYGVTPKSIEMPPEFVRSVRRGWEYLLKQQNSADGSFFREKEANDSHRFYTHGLCTAALCEYLAMTGSETLLEPAQRAADYCIRHQSVPTGGWRYRADRFSAESDVSVTGWMVLALKSGEAAGLNVPPEVFANVSRFLDSVMKSDQYMYREAEPELRISMTAEAILCRMLLGWKQGDNRLETGIQQIRKHPPSFDDHYKRDVYYWFYATQVLYHYGGGSWMEWNNTMREILPKNQDRSNDQLLRGSWNPHRPVRDAWGTQYGRLYTTCLSIYILEVYYRHQRIYGD
jgi:hypothetical protein